MHDRFNVVKVHHHSPKCLVEEIAHGPTISKVLHGVGRDWRSHADDKLSATMELLTEYHRAVFGAFIKDGLIHSDIHLGNAVLQTKSDGSLSFSLFDVGQFDRIGPADTKAILWALSWLSSIERHSLLQNVALNHLTATSCLRENRDDWYA